MNNKKGNPINFVNYKLDLAYRNALPISKEKLKNLLTNLLCTPRSVKLAPPIHEKKS